MIKNINNKNTENTPRMIFFKGLIGLLLIIHSELCLLLGSVQSQHIWAQSSTKNASLPSAVKTHHGKAQATKNYGFRAILCHVRVCVKGFTYYLTMTNSQKHQNGQQVPTQGKLKTENMRHFEWKDQMQSITKYSQFKSSSSKESFPYFPTLEKYTLKYALKTEITTTFICW